MADTDHSTSDTTDSGAGIEPNTPQPAEAEVTGVLADIRDEPRIRRLFEEIRPELVFHAFHTVGASSGEHNILAWGYSPSDFSADIATAA